MKNVSLFSLSCFCAAELFAAASAVPRVDERSVSIEQDFDRQVSVFYTLTDAPGIITVDFQTNSAENVWVSIGTENFSNVGGDVNCIVSELDVPKKITWSPDVSWGGHFITNGLRAVVKAWALDNPPQYMAVNLGVDGFMAFYPDAGAVPGGISNDIYKTEWLLMRRIPAANVVWRMGSPIGEIGKNYDDVNNIRETPHMVRLSEDYYMAVYETTQYQYLRAMKQGVETVSGSAGLLPKARIKWDDIRGKGSPGEAYEWPKNKSAGVSPASFMGVLRSRYQAVNSFDLPTEAQWEYACRAGCGSALYNGTELDGDRGTASSNIVGVVGWCSGLVDSAQRVGQKIPNSWGLYDMLGNVEEWCLDWWAQQNTPGVELLVPGRIYDDPEGPSVSLDGSKSCRGGSYAANPANVRCAARSQRIAPNGVFGAVGFRICARAVVSLQETDR